MTNLEKLLGYVRQNRCPLFKTDDVNPLLAFFDLKGFWFSNAAQLAYSQVKNEPHLYVAHTDSNSGWYVGKSFQPGGRWKRQHAYHLGTLAYHLLGTIRYDDQNHQHWIECWMNNHTLRLSSEVNSIALRQQIFITFLPFRTYTGKEFNELRRKEVIVLNHQCEQALIGALSSKGILLLNVPRTSPMGSARIPRAQARQTG